MNLRYLIGAIACLAGMHVASAAMETSAMNAEKGTMMPKETMAPRGEPNMGKPEMATAAGEKMAPMAADGMMKSGGGMMGDKMATMTPMRGEMAPAFSLATLEGKQVDLAALTKQGPVVLVILRGYPGYQCPMCTRQVNDFAAHAKDFAAKGAKVVMVYPGPAMELKARAGEFLADKRWPRDYVFLLDPDYTFTKAYGLRWDAMKETAYPSTFVIGRDGKIAWAKVSKTHGDRSSAEDVLAKL